MLYLTLPDSDKRLYVGSVVIFNTIPDVRWILHFGWYLYEDDQFNGWYFRSIPVGNILPAEQADLSNLTIIDNSAPGHLIPPAPTPPGPIPPGPFPPVPPGDPVVPFRQSMRDMLYAAFISVETVDDMYAIDTTLIPNGKLVRVNNVNGKVVYYAWDAYNSVWVDGGLIPDLSNYVTIEEFNELADDVDVITGDITWTEFSS